MFCSHLDLRVENLRVSLLGRPILHGLNLGVRQGEVVAVLGGNGHGKSTLLRSIAGILPAEGSIILRGENISGMRADQVAGLGVTYVAQSNVVFPSLSVAENLKIASGHWRSTNDKHEYGAMDLFPELGALCQRSAGDLSRGQQQMVALGRILSLKSTMLILDEPSVGLTDAIWRRVREVLRKRADAGLPILIVEHQLDRLSGLADRAYVVRHGRIGIEGSWSDEVAVKKMKRYYLGQDA